MLSTSYLRRILTIIQLLLGISTGMYAQLSISTGILTPKQLVEDVLIGNGVLVSNISVGAQTQGGQIGTFNNTNSNLPLSKGIIMSTGYANNAVTGIANATSGFTSVAPGCATAQGLCSAGDSTLTNIAGLPTSDAAVLEFDFIPLADTIRFRYVFASEEYTEYNCSQFNDVFGFILSGAGLSSPKNLAVIPNTTIPVSVNTINNGTVGSNGTLSNCQAPLGSLLYTQYYIDNWGGSYVQFDGMTTILEAKHAVVPCSTYHIKLTIADVFDGALDSGVFLEANSFYSDAIQVGVVTPRNDSTIVEDCSNAFVTFKKQVPVAQNTPINYQFFGTATFGTDFTLSTNNIEIAAGTDSFAVEIIPVNDGIIEGTETLYMAIESSVCKWDTVQLYIREEVILPPSTGACTNSNALSIYYSWTNGPQAVAYAVSSDNGATWDTVATNAYSLHNLRSDSTVNLIVRSVGGYNICNFNEADTISCSTVYCGLTANLDATSDASCFGIADGQAVITASGGTAPYSYVVNDSITLSSGTIPNLAGGLNKVTIWDQDSCQVELQFAINEPLPINLLVTSTTTNLCSYSNEATAQLNAINGIGGYTFTLNGVSNNVGFFDSLYTGTYEIMVQDGNGCEMRDSLVIAAPQPVTMSFLNTSTTCYGASDGSTTVSAVGGTPIPAVDYTYVWSPSGQTGPIATNLLAGTHVVSVTDNNGCLFTDSTIITQPNPFSFTQATMTEPLCNGYDDGSASVSVLGGVGGYSYTWSATNSTTNVINNVAAGTYTVTVSDLNNCMDSFNVNITEPVPLQITNLSTTPVTCNGGADGTAWVTVDFQNPTFQWMPSGQTGAVATGLSAGEHIVTASDFKGCQVTDTILVEEPTPIIAIFNELQMASCYKSSDGIMGVTASGGTPWSGSVYTYEWNTFPTQQTAIANGLIGGQSYTVTITDSLGCEGIKSVTVSHPDSIYFSYDIQDVSCAFGNDGKAVITGNGGTPPFTYQWNTATTGQTTDTAINLAAGRYLITATDHNGCVTNTEVQVNQPLPLQSQLTGTDILCTNDSTGVVILQNSGGVSPYQYQWNATNQNTNTLNGVVAGTYTVTTTDANGCTRSDSITITEPTKALSTLLRQKEVTCYGGRDGEIILTVDGGKPPYKYKVNDNIYNTANHIVGLFADDYVVRIKDANGCLLDTTATISEPPEMTVFIENDYEIELGDSVTLSSLVTNGIEPITYRWTPPTTLSCSDCPNPSAKPSTNEYYSVKITDARNCEAEDQTIVRVIKPRDIYVATAFSPNNDGINDYLFVQANDFDNLQVLLFRVYDRWGELVFESTNTTPNQPESGWDGAIGGMLMNGQVFSWFAEIEFQDGEVRSFKGNATMVR